MAEITAGMVKELREKTDAPMMECKKLAGGGIRRGHSSNKIHFPLQQQARINLLQHIDRADGHQKQETDCSESQCIAATLAKRRDIQLIDAEFAERIQASARHSAVRNVQVTMIGRAAPTCLHGSP